MSSTSTSNIGLGALSTSSTGGTSLSSTLFGIDINTLVDNLVTAKGIINTQRQVKIDANTAKLSAYSTLSGLLTTLKSSATALRNPTVISGDTNAFNAKQTLSKETGSIAASSLFGISAADSAANGNYSLTINSVAKTDTISGTMAIGNTGTVTPLTADGTLSIEGTNISLTSTMTLSQIKDAINNQSSTTKVSASIIQAGASDYRLVLKSTDTGNAITLTGSDAQVLTDLGLAPSGETDASLSASMVLDGVTVTRSTNNINDLISGISLSLFQADPGKPVSITVDTNLTNISNAVSSFMDAYNALVDFVQKQRAVGSDGSVGTDQVLFSDPLMQSVYRAVQSIVGSGATGIDSGNLKSLRDVGIDLTQDGKLEVFDENLFEDNLLDHLDQVKALFGFAGNASNGISVVDRPDSIPSSLLGQTVTVRVTATDGSGTPTAAEFELNGVVTAATIANGFIRGATGTDYEGIVVGYDAGVVSGTPFTGTIKLTQGIADQIAASLEPVLNSSTGTLKAATDTLTSTNTRLNTQITDTKSQLDLYRNRLLLQFQAAQEAIAALESQKTSIESYVNSLNGKN